MRLSVGYWPQAYGRKIGPVYRSACGFRVDRSFRQFLEPPQIDSPRGFYSHRHEELFIISYDYPFLIDPQLVKARAILALSYVRLACIGRL